MQPNLVKTFWRQDKTVINAWATLPSAFSAEVMARAGYDSVTLDIQHGLADYSTALAAVQAINATPAVPLARVPWNDPAVIMRLLDLGVQGIICPMINNRAQAEAFAGACRYAPAGYRSIGPLRAQLVYGEDYVPSGDDFVITFAMIETSEALQNVEAIASTPGLDALYIGPVDLSKSLGLPDLYDLRQPGMQAACQKVIAAARKFGRIAGIHASTPANAIMLSKMGFRFVTPVNDTHLLRSAAIQALDQTRAGFSNP
ncbi:MAG TPA: aldolase/citrate lyase family protein [Anaerolineaceae bacterium]